MRFGQAVLDYSPFFIISTVRLLVHVVLTMSNIKDKVFSLEGKGLKLDSAADLEPHIADLRSSEDIEEVRLLGNTLGVEACKLLGEVLSTKKTLKVDRCPVS